MCKTCVRLDVRKYLPSSVDVCAVVRQGHTHIHKLTHVLLIAFAERDMESSGGKDVLWIVWESDSDQRGGCGDGMKHII